MARQRGKQPRSVRQQLSKHEDGAYLYAPFAVQFRAGLASTLPFMLIFFVAQPVSDAMTTLTMGGFTIGPVVIAAFALGWALMSKALLHVLRYNTHEPTHFIAYAIAGAVILTVVSLAIITVINGIRNGEWLPQESSAFSTMITWAPVVGALGSLVGRWALRTGITWYVWIERRPLLDVFDFVDGRRDRDSFERM